ncbi:shikimate dehydrogenase family protein [Shumkonia mesophila]|uniref:shikimate dehydrogenase family protein n=1 Tax=Shumkonia mesophila TaxID=2838854 RepID=UPI0029341F20|nr:shikimate dehydrogenase [Shumkonia mesophila]
MVPESHLSPALAGMRKPIQGSTILTGTIADPVAHVQAPESMGAWFAERGIDAVWLPFHVRPEGLAAFVEGARALVNLAGFTVTMPHKQAIVPLLDEVSPRVGRCGAANLIRREANGRLIGDIADGIGFVAGLRDSGVAIAGRTVGLMGAGGAGTAIAWALAEENPAALAIADLDGARLDRLTADIAAAFPNVSVSRGWPDLRAFDIAVNATPSGLHAGDPLPFEPGDLRRNATVVEIIMKPPVTPLMARAAALGMKVVPGQRMLDGQLAIYAQYLGLA